MTVDTKFGIELECFIKNSQRANYAPGGYHSGRRIADRNVNWNAQSDISLRNEWTGTHFAAEVVSSPMSGERGLAETYYVCEKLQAADAKVNSSTGLHVHVDAKDLSVRQVNNIKKSFKRYEMAFFGMSGSDIVTRMNSTFCTPSQNWTGDRNRYQSLNVSNVGSRRCNTIEIRCFAGTINPWQAVVCEFMSVALVSRAREAIAPYSTRITDPVEAAEAFCRHYIKSEYLPVGGTEEELQDIKDTIIGQAQKAKDSLAARGLI